MGRDITIRTKYKAGESNNRKVGTKFSFDEESNDLELPMASENSFVSNDEALKLAKFILNNTNHKLFRTMENSLKNLRSVLNDYEDEGLKKHNQLYINRMESALRKLQKIDIDGPELY